MSSGSRYLFIITAVFSILISSYSYGNESASGKQLNDAESPVDQSGILFFPLAGLQLEGCMFSDNDVGYRMYSGRIIDLDILRINRIFFSLYVNEFLVYDDISGDIEPKSINYQMDFFRVNMEFSYGVLSWFFDHNCRNIYNENHTEDRQARWYGYGITWETYGFRPGRKDVKGKNAGFILPDNLKYKVSAEKKIHTRVLHYDYMITGIARYDLLFLNYFIPYIEGSFTSIIDKSVRFNRYFEAGLRIPFEKGDLTVFTGMDHKHDIEYYNTGALEWYFYGLRGETLLGTGADTGGIKSGKGKLPGFPDFHFSGSYGKFFANDDLNFNTDFSLGLDWMSTCKTSPFMNTSIIHSSYKRSTGMFPRYIKSSIETGIAHRIDLLNAFIEPSYIFTRYDSGNYGNGYVEKFSSISLRIESMGMKTGYANKGIDFDSPSGSQWINRIDWMLSASKVVKENYYDYEWDCDAGIRWNICRYYRSVPYVALGAGLFKDNNYDAVYDVEPGIRFRHGIYWMLFYRYEYRTDIDTDKGYFRDYHLAGVRLEI